MREDVAAKVVVAVALDACKVNDQRVPTPTAQKRPNKATHAFLATLVV